MTRFGMICICTLRQGRKDHVIYYTPCMVVRVWKLRPKEGIEIETRHMNRFSEEGGTYNVQTKGGREKEVLRENGGTEEEERERERSYDGS